MRSRRRVEKTNNDNALFLEYRKHLWEAGKSASDNTDKAILTLSAGALALSMTFLKDIVPLKDVIELHLIIIASVSVLMPLLPGVWAGALTSKRLENISRQPLATRPS